MHIVTHDGRFHADEVMAMVILNLAFPGSSYSRTRSMEAIRKADIVIDVGDKYDPETLRFDHHQVKKPAELARHSGVPYASAGLVWRQFGESVLQRIGYPITVCKELAMRVDMSLIAAIDAEDTGHGQKQFPCCSINDVIGLMNPGWDESATEEEAFTQAMLIAEGVLRRQMCRSNSAIAAGVYVRNAERICDGRVIILEVGMPWKFEVYNEPRIVYVVSPASGEGDTKWTVQAVGKNANQRELRQPLPASWGGTRMEALRAATGVDDATFCHNSLKICGAGSRDGAIRLAELAVMAPPAN